MYFFADKEIFCRRSSEGEYVRFLFFCSVENILFFSIKKEERHSEDWGMNWKEQQTGSRRNILRAYVTISLNFKEQDVMI